MVERLSVRNKRPPPCEVPKADVSASSPHEVQRNYEKIISTRAKAATPRSPTSTPNADSTQWRVHKLRMKNADSPQQSGTNGLGAVGPSEAASPSAPGVLAAQFEDAAQLHGLNQDLQR